MAENVHKKRRMGTIVGWLSVIAGVLLIVWNVFVIQRLIRTEAMDTPHLLMIASPQRGPVPAMQAPGDLDMSRLPLGERHARKRTLPSFAGLYR